MFPETAISEVYLDEQLIDTFESRGGQTRLRHVTLAAVSESPVSIHFKVDSHERQNLGLRLDWVSLKTGERSRIRARGWALWLPGILATFLYALFRVARFERRPAIVLVLPWIATTAICARFDPFSFAFVIQKIAPAAIVLSLFAAWWLRRRDSGRWALAIFVLGFLVKGAGLFHPVTFYPDVANMRRYVDIYPETTGTMAQRGVATQEQTGVGYPRTVGGKDYAFPYSPLYFLPFTYLPTPGAVEDGVRLFGLAAASLQVLAVFWLATTLFDARVAVAAAFFSAFLPPLFSRLVLALHATLVGHFLDLLAMSAVLLLSLKPESSKRFAAVGGATLVSFLEYTSSYFSLTAFIGIFALFDRRLTFRLVGVLLVAGTLTILGLYGPFVWAFATEMLPAFLAGTAGVSASGSRAPPLAALSRIPLFYGYLYPALALVGFALARRRTTTAGYRFLVVYGLAFVLLASSRAFGGETFKDLKEITFVGPFIAMLSGLTVAELSRRGRAGFIAAVVLSASLAVFGVNKYRSYLVSYASPLMAADRSGQP